MILEHSSKNNNNLRLFNAVVDPKRIKEVTSNNSYNKNAG